MKRVLCLFLIFAMMTSLSVPVFSEGTEGTFKINKTHLEAGVALPVENAEGLDLKYYVDGEFVGEGTLTLTEDLYEKWITVKAYDGGEEVAEDRAYFSRLPVLYIETDDGRPVTSKVNYKSGTMFIQNNGGTGKVIYDGAIQIKGRGNTSWGWPKKPYKIKLDKKTDLFGMGKNKHWVLGSNYLDECFLRNKTAYDLSNELGLEYMQSVWADVVINGEYAGNYLLCEQIRIDDTRVNIYDWESEAEDVAKAIVKAQKKLGVILDQDALEEVMVSDLSWITTGTVDFEGATYETGKVYDDLTGGYLFELSNEYDEVSKFTTDRGLKVMLKSPEYLSTNAAMTDSVTDLWQTFEDAYCSEDGYADTSVGRVHYTEIADIDSMVAYWLVMEITGNIDSVYKSRYAYKGKDSLLTFGPTWDFDWGCASITVSSVAVGWKISKSTNNQCFFREWIDDPLFFVKATEAYWKVRPYLETLIEDGGALERNIEYLHESGLADGAVWDRHVKWPDTARGFEDDAAVYLQFLRDRIAWLDEQFSTDTMMWKSLYTQASSYPYKRWDKKFTFNIPGSYKDSVSYHAPADAVVRTGQDVAASVVVNDAATTLVNVYVNGLFYGAYQPQNKRFTAELPEDCLTAERGRKNVISVIGKNDAGETTYKSFYTVIQSETGVKVSFDGEEGLYNPGDEIALPVPETVIEGGTARRFFTRSGAAVERGAFDKSAGTSNGRTYSLTVPYGDVELTPEFVLVGDVTGDGLITISDVPAIKQMLAGGDALPDTVMEASDINFDGLDTLPDLSALKKMLAGGYTPEG